MIFSFNLNNNSHNGGIGDNIGGDIGDKLGENQSACISSAVDSLVYLNNSSSKERDEMVRKGKETLEA